MCPFLRHSVWGRQGYEFCCGRCEGAADEHEELCEQDQGDDWSLVGSPLRQTPVEFRNAAARRRRGCGGWAHRGGHYSPVSPAEDHHRERANSDDLASHELQHQRVQPEDGLGLPLHPYIEGIEEKFKTFVPVNSVSKFRKISSAEQMNTHLKLLKGPVELKDYKSRKERVLDFKEKSEPKAPVRRTALTKLKKTVSRQPVSTQKLESMKENW